MKYKYDKVQENLCLWILSIYYCYREIHVMCFTFYQYICDQTNCVCLVEVIRWSDWVKDNCAFLLFYYEDHLTNPMAENPEKEIVIFQNFRGFRYFTPGMLMLWTPAV